MKTAKEALAKSLKTLLQTRSFDEIAVKQIVLDSGVNRQTFYYHFQDKFDCLQYLFFNEARDLIPEQILLSEWKARYLSVFRYLDVNHNFCRHVEVSSGYSQLSDFVLDCINLIVQGMTRNVSVNAADSFGPGKDLSVLEYGLQGVIMNWFRDGLRENPTLLIDGAANFTEEQLEILLRDSQCVDKSDKVSGC